MFNVIRKRDDEWVWMSEEVTVYDVRRDSNGYPQFLTYCDGQWRYESAKHFRPKRNSMYSPD